MIKESEPGLSINDNLKWEIVSSKYIYEDNWFTARRDRCRMPSGKIVDPYYILEYPNWVNAVALTATGNILMIRQYRHALGETIVEIPGGSMDPTDESPEFAMKRELSEETGYEFEAIERIGEISPNPSTNSNITYMFIAKGGKKVTSQHLDPSEEIEVMEMKSEEVITLLKENKIRQALHATCLFYAFLRMGWITYSEKFRNI